MPSPPPLLPPKGQQQHNTNGVHSPLVTSAMLNSLMRHLQQNKMFAANCSAPTAMPTFPAVAQYPSTMSCNVHNIGTNVHEALFCNNNNNNVQSNGGTATAALFAKTVDSLHNFLSPNVVLLPVAFHSLDDEQHIQLIGMPQTVIPIAIHPAMQKQFAVRPLLVDQAMARQQQQPPHDGGSSCSSTTTSIATLPQHIGIGRVGDNECVFWQQQHHHQPSEEHFQLPIALRPSLVHYAQNEQKQQQQQDFLPTECNFHPKNGRQRPSSSSVDKVVVGDDECKTEPLDLSLTTRTKTNENGVGGIGSVVTETPLVQRRKRTNKGRTDEMAEKEKKLGKTTPESVLDDERRPSPTGTTLTTSSSIPLCCSSPSAFGPPPLIVVPVSTTASPSCSSSSAVVFTNGTTKCSSTAATVSAAATALTAADSSTRKRFLCDLCGDVSFLALETLIGHQKYYCRNRPRLDDVPEPSCCPTNSVKKLVVVPNNGIINSASSSTVTTAHHSLSSSAKKAAVMNAQCPFQAVNNESISAHQKQQQHSALPVICADCGYRAFTVRGLRTHVRLSHGTNSAEQTAAVNNKRAAATTNGNGAAEAGERMASLDGGTTKYFEGTAAEGGE